MTFFSLCFRSSTARIVTVYFVNIEQTSIWAVFKSSLYIKYALDKFKCDKFVTQFRKNLQKEEKL